MPMVIHILQLDKQIYVEVLCYLNKLDFLNILSCILGGNDPMDQIRFIPDDRYVALTSPNRTIRLVDGPSVNEGIIQLLEGDYWRTVCTNSRNWTVSDMNVACRQLGFTGGEWYHWYPHLNDTRQIMFQEPGKNNSRMFC